MRQVDPFSGEPVWNTAAPANSRNLAELSPSGSNSVTASPAGSNEVEAEMPTPFYLKTGDTSPALSVTLKDGDGAAVDLTGATVVFNMNDEDGAQVINRGASTLVDAASGKAKYAWSAADTAAAGYYTAEFEVTYSDATVETFPNRGYLEVHIIDDLE